MTYRRIAGQGDEADIVEWRELPNGVPSNASEGGEMLDNYCLRGLIHHRPIGNFLEAINVCLNILDKHYMDRDLSRAGQSILMISAGCGVFKVWRAAYSPRVQLYLRRALLGGRKTDGADQTKDDG